MVFSGAALPAPYSILEVGPLGPAGGATERAELGYGASGAVYASTAGVDVLVFYNRKWWRVRGVCAWAVATVATSWVSLGVALGPVQAPAPTPGAGFAVKLV